MAFDYSALAATAHELVTEFGKSITLRRLNSTPPDSATPWIPAEDPRADATELIVFAVMVEPSSLRELGGPNAQLVDWVKRAQQIAIVSSALELSEYSELVDTDATLWRIVGVSTLNPGGTRLLHFIGVAR